MNELEATAAAVVPTAEEWQPGDVVIDNHSDSFSRVSAEDEAAGLPWAYATENTRSFVGGPNARRAR
ncbi:hypothetical protein E1286_43890 [Nonomuraea terrae]|uniref:Uncharacterized protein n=1 Tax=Nonomuraea terrae TaxID=2530383 RepID=A0A4V2YHT6_9ACTN|nr:hypothetical protein [Nonomuraea terrae]TDD32197.1 hypothetical protein E1286_43890 [Nonomuraea terrae]